MADNSVGGRNGGLIASRRGPRSEGHGRPVGRGGASAKLILFGEHMVLYGRPAISLAVPALPVTATAYRCGGPVVIESSGFDTGRRSRTTTSHLDTSAVPRLAVSAACEYLERPDDGITVDVESSIPAGRGFGSSAACAAAIIEAVVDLWGQSVDDDTMFELIQHSETVAHGEASGVDARTVISDGGPLWFDSGVVSSLTVGAEGRRTVVVVADTGVAASTRDAVATVRRRLGVLGQEGVDLLDAAGAMTVGAVDDLVYGRLVELGSKMTANQELLRVLGVSCPEIDTLVAAALEAGALGAKLSGGGMGGCVIALAQDEVAATALRRELATAGARATFTVALSPGPAS